MQVRALAALLSLGLIADPAPAATPLAVVWTREALDVANCQVWHNGKAGALDEPRMLYALGLAPNVEAPWRLWSAGRVDGESAQGDTFHYRVALRQPVTVGSVLTTLGRVQLLKADAPYPGDPENPAHWLTVPVPAAVGPRLAPLERALPTRAVLFTEVRKSGTSTLGPVRIYTARCVNVAPLAGARARSEYHAPARFGGGAQRAIDVARGHGSWVSAGVNDEGNIPVPVIGELNAQWYVLAWDQPRTLTGLYLQDNFAELRIDGFTGAAGVTALAGLDAEWRRIPAAQVATTSQQGRWITFTEPLRTSGLRLRIPRALTQKGASSQIATLDALLVFEDLGEAPAPVVVTAPPPPRFAIPLQLPQDGLLTLAVDDAQGRRVRNLVARTARTAGPLSAPWDLADEGGRLVAPGVYRWKALTAPPLELRYEFSVYPNVSQLHPENSAWLNGHDGPGGWLADHSPPRGACAADDFVFFGAPVPESGVGFAACDLTGRKLWGIHSFAAWSAGHGMATDGRTVFVQHGGSGHYGAADEGADRVWGVDIASHAWRTVLVAQQSERRRRGITGMAARDGKLVLAVHAAEDGMANACGWEAVDVAQSRPAYREARKPKVPYEIVPDPRNDFLRLFRLKGVPPGYGHPGGQGLIWLESTRGPERRQHILLAFNKPVPVGSCVLPVPLRESYRVRLSILKPDAPYPPNPARRDQWQDLTQTTNLAWDVAVAPSNTATRALLVTFVKGDEDELSDALEARPTPAQEGPSLDLDVPASAALGLDESGASWVGRLEGLRILRRRFANLSGSATVRVNSGALDRDGVWDAQRTEPLSRAAPAVYLMEWRASQTLRGLAIKEIDCELTEVDAYVGPPESTPDLNGSDHWTKVGQYIPNRRMAHSGFAGHNAQARYMDDMVDFGSNVVTRAIRLRVVSQWTVATREGSCAKDGLGLDAARCRVFGVAPLQYLGGEVPVDATASERLEIVDATTGQIEREVALRKPADLAFAPDGRLYAVSDSKLVTVDLAQGTSQPFPADVLRPGPLACDRQGRLYVFDAAPERRVVRVYDAAGAFIRQVGEPGGYQVGPWNPNRLQALTALAVDREGKLWCVDGSYWPKRVSCWGPEGQFLREYLGPTAYGGGGVLDPGDKRRLFYGPLEFELDWQAGTSRLKNLTWNPADGHAAGEVPIRIDGRTYLVTRTQFMKQPCAIVYLYETDRLRRVAALGAAEAFAPLKAPAILGALGSRPLEQFEFVWSDANGDGDVQFGECVFSPPRGGHLSDFTRDLGISAGNRRFTVAKFLPNGAPVYAEQTEPLPTATRTGDGAMLRLNDGSFYRFGDGPALPDAGFGADGTLRWTYRNEGAGVGPDRSCGPYTPDQVVCQFGVVGHATAKAGDLGEFFVINANLGSWNVWSADGLLAGRIFRDLRDGRRVSWTMSEHTRGLRLDDVTAGQEHFQGWFCRTEPEGRYYAVAGHNHASLVEVVGLDAYRRLGGDLRVTAEDLAQAQAWTKEVAKFRAREEARVLSCFSIEGVGLEQAWPDLPAASLKPDPLDPRRSVTFQMGHDRANLYARYVVRGAGPFRNAGKQWDRMFKTGAAVDLMLGLDDRADAARRAPVAGDKRILASLLDGKPVVVLYDAVVPEAPADQRWEVTSPVAQLTFDVVRRLPEAGLTVAPLLAVATLPDSVIGYIVELTIPLGSIGLKPATDTRIRFDWGILETDEPGASVLRRAYWSNQTTSTLADAPSEARLEPDLWGWALFPGRNREAAALSEPANLLDPNQAAADEFELEEK